MVGVGWYIAICIAGGVFVGRWLDGKLNTSPFLIIIGLIVGCVMAFFGVYHLLIPIKEDQQDKERR